MSHPTPAQLRAEAEQTLTPLGRKRLRLLAQLEDLDAELRPLVLRAVDVELPLRRINELTGIAPNTVRAWRRKAADGSESD